MDYGKCFHSKLDKQENQKEKTHQDQNQSKQTVPSSVRPGIHLTWCWVMKLQMCWAAPLPWP
jgi:hypothetical protein